MPDIITALVNRRSALERRKAQIQADADRQIKKINTEIRKIKDALDTVNKALSGILCPVCGGTGSVRRPDAAGQMEDWTCDACQGTGIKQIGEKVDGQINP